MLVALKPRNCIIWLTYSASKPLTTLYPQIYSLALTSPPPPYDSQNSRPVPLSGYEGLSLSSISIFLCPLLPISIFLLPTTHISVIWLSVSGETFPVFLSAIISLFLLLLNLYSPWSESKSGLKTLKLNQLGNFDLRGY